MISLLSDLRNFLCDIHPTCLQQTLVVMIQIIPRPSPLTVPRHLAANQLTVRASQTGFWKMLLWEFWVRYRYMYIKLVMEFTTDITIAFLANLFLASILAQSIFIGGHLELRPCDPMIWQTVGWTPPALKWLLLPKQIRPLQTVLIGLKMEKNVPLLWHPLTQNIVNHTHYFKQLFSTKG